MSLNGGSGTRSAGRSIPFAVFAVGLVIVAGAAMAATSAYFVLRGSASSSAGTTPPPAGGAPSGTTNSSGNHTSAPVPGNLTFTDDLGRSVTVPVDPARVVALGPSIVDSIVRLGVRSHLVGVDCYAPALGGLSEDYDAAQQALWNLSSSMCVETGPAFSAEELLNLSPDLVLASTIVSASSVEQIEGQFHIPVLMLQPSTLGGIEVDVSMMGQIFNATSRADVIIGQLQSDLAEAQNVSLDLTDSGASLPTVLLTYYVDPADQPDPGYYSYGPGTFGESLLEIASATSICANSTIPYPLLTGDQVLVSDPQFIVLGTGYGLNESTYAQGPDWGSFSAVANHSVYSIDSNVLTEPDPTMILVGLPELLHLLHPDLVPAA